MSVLFNQTNVAPGTTFITPGGGGGSNDPNPAFSTIKVQAVSGVSTLNCYIAAPSGSPNSIPIDAYMLVNSNSQGGRVSFRTTWDASDSGALVSCVMGSDGTNGTAFIGSEWPGYITMPFTIYGATISLVSDNETFFFLDGKAGAIGNISTGVEFNSASNVLNTITDPTKTYTADMTALLSTFRDLYPTCFI